MLANSGIPWKLGVPAVVAALLITRSPQKSS